MLAFELFRKNIAIGLHEIILDEVCVHVGADDLNDLCNLVIFINFDGLIFWVAW